MKSDCRPLLTAIVGTPEAGASGTFIITDVLAAVGRTWEALHDEKPRPAVFLPKLLSVDGQPYSEINGVVLQPHGALGDFPAPDIVIVPSLNLLQWEPLPSRYAPIIDWIRSAYESGAIVASLCSGSLLLAETGLLDGEDATSHWAYCDAIAKRRPEVRMRRERTLVPAGPGHRLITAGGASSWHDLLLYLIGRFSGPEEARRVARIFQLEWHSEGQLPVAALTLGRQRGDKLVAAAQIWAADNYANPNPVTAMAAQSGLGERSFLRRFRQATGQSPMEYVQTLRIEEAKQLLDTTDMPLDDVAAEVGYVEPASFRRLFRKLVGLSPSAYRRRHSPGLAQSRMEGRSTDAQRPVPIPPQSTGSAKGVSGSLA